MDHPQSEPENNSNEEVFFSLSSTVSDTTLSASEAQQNASSQKKLGEEGSTIQSKGAKFKLKPRKLFPKKQIKNTECSSDTTPESSNAQEAIRNKKKKEKNLDVEVKGKNQKLRMIKKFAFGKRSKVAPINLNSDSTTSSNTTPNSTKRQTPEGATLSISEDSLLETDDTHTLQRSTNSKELLKEEQIANTNADKKKHSKVSSIKFLVNKPMHKLERLPTPPPTPPSPYKHTQNKNNKPISTEIDTKFSTATTSDKVEIMKQSQYSSTVEVSKKETTNLDINKSTSDIVPSLHAPPVPYTISEREIAHILDKSLCDIDQANINSEQPIPFSSIESTDSDRTIINPNDYLESIKTDRKSIETEKVFTVINEAGKFMKRSEKTLDPTDVKKSKLNESNKATSSREKSKNSQVEKKKKDSLIPTVRVQRATTPYQVTYSSKESLKNLDQPNVEEDNKSSEEGIHFRIGTPVRPTKPISSSVDNTLLEDISTISNISSKELGSFSSDSQSPPLSESSRRTIKYDPDTTDDQILLEPGSFGPSSEFLSDYSIDYSLNPLSMSKFPSDEDPVNNMTSNLEKREHLYKILVIGELGTGKTSFIKRYVHQFFSQNYRATIGVDFALKVLNWDQNTIIRLQLWDIAGQERFGNMTRVYYKEAVGAFIVFDVTRTATFDAVIKWKQDLDSKVQLPDGSPIPCILLANKSDQPKQGIATTPGKLDEYVKDNGFTAWYETSAKENMNIDEAARALVNKILANDKLINGNDINNDGFAIDGKRTTDASSSCSC